MIKRLNLNLNMSLKKMIMLNLKNQLKIKNINIIVIISKVKKIIEGGETGQLSIINALKEADNMFGGENPIVLIHDRC